MHTFDVQTFRLTVVLSSCIYNGYLSVLALPCTVCLLRRASKSVPEGRTGPGGGRPGMPGGMKGGIMLPPKGPGGPMGPLFGWPWGCMGGPEAATGLWDLCLLCQCL